MHFDYITFRDAGNAGDNLIGYTAQRLLSHYIQPSVPPTVCHIKTQKYDKICFSKNIIFGPGGIVSGSDDSNEPDRIFAQHVTHKLLDDWSRQDRRVFFFGSGTNAAPGYRDFFGASEKLLAHLASVSRWLFLRGDADINKISEHIAREDHRKLIFQPCPSIFLDRVYDMKHQASDRVAINLGFGKLTAEEIAIHPINRFVDAVRAEGLTPVLFANHATDVNEAAAELFRGEGCFNSPKYSEDGRLKTIRANRKKSFPNRLHQDADLARDFNGYRFAFGNRLHGFLPFTSFDTPASFLNTRPVRRPLPFQYFGEESMSAPFDRKKPEASVDRMISVLKTFIKDESRLRSKIAERRDMLWEVTQKNLKTLHESMIRD